MIHMRRCREYWLRALAFINESNEEPVLYFSRPSGF